MKGKISHITPLVLTVLLAGMSSLAVPVDPPHPYEALSSHHHQYHPQEFQAAAPVSQQYDPFQVWLQQQSTTGGQADHQHLNLPSYTALGLHHGLNPAAAQFAPPIPIQDSNPSNPASLWHEQQQQPRWLWDQSQEYLIPNPLTLSDDHPMNTFRGNPGAPSLPQSRATFPGRVHDTYYNDPSHQMTTEEWQPQFHYDASFFPPVSIPADGQEGWIGVPLMSQVLAPPTISPQQAGHYSSTSTLSAEESNGHIALPEPPPSSSRSGQSSDEEEGKAVAENDPISVAIKTWVPYMKIMRYKWEKPYSPTQRRKIIGTIVAQWVKLKAPEELSFDLAKPIDGLRKALRAGTAEAVWNGDTKAINDLAVGSKARGRGSGSRFRSSLDEGVARDLFADLRDHPEVASPADVQGDRDMRNMEKQERIKDRKRRCYAESRQYSLLQKADKSKLDHTL